MPLFRGTATFGAAGKFSTYAVARTEAFTGQECLTNSPLRMTGADGDISGTLSTAFTESLEQSWRSCSAA